MIKDGYSPRKDNWWFLKMLNGKFLRLHQSFHLGIENTYQMASRLFEGKNVMKTLKNIIRDVRFVRKTTLKTEKLVKPGLQQCGKYPGEDLEIDLVIGQQQKDFLAYRFG